MTPTTSTSDPTSVPPIAPTAPPDVVAGIYAAFGRGDMPSLLALLHPEVDWSVDVIAPGAELVPMLRNGTGYTAVEHYFGGVAQLEFQVFDVRRLIADGDVVIAEIHLEATHRVTGKRANIDELHHWTVRDSVAVRYRPYLDTAALIELFRP